MNSAVNVVKPSLNFTNSSICKELEIPSCTDRLRLDPSVLTIPYAVIMRTESIRRPEGYSGIGAPFIVKVPELARFELSPE